jgi:hypothetical protein
MPWKVVKRGGKKPWKIVKKTTGEIVGSSTSKEQAMASVRARYAAEGGAMKKKGGKK